MGWQSAAGTADFGLAETLLLMRSQPMWSRKASSSQYVDEAFAIQFHKKYIAKPMITIRARILMADIFSLACLRVTGKGSSPFQYVEPLRPKWYVSFSVRTDKTYPGIRSIGDRKFESTASRISLYATVQLPHSSRSE